MAGLSPSMSFLSQVKLVSEPTVKGSSGGPQRTGLILSSVIVSAYANQAHASRTNNSFRRELGNLDPS